jgi:SET domain-containing protein
MNTDFLHNFPIKIGLSNIEGRGVFATRDIKEGQIIERCPLVPLSFRSKYHSDPQLYRYLYSQPTCPCDECKNHGFIFHMVLGYGMMYNHQDNANTEWKFDYPNLRGDIIAIKDIQAEDEIFVDYGTKYFSDKPKIEMDHAKNNQ